MIKYIIALLYLFSLHSFGKTPKVLMLIIASDQFPVYVELQKMWRSYMHSNPHIQTYFIKGDPHLTSEVQQDGDIIWSKVIEGWTTPTNTPQGFIPPSAGVITKTILSLDYFYPRFSEFDYIIRTNLSSFYNFSRLLRFLSHLPKTRCYCGSNIGEGSTIASGCGFIMSTDVAAELVKNKYEFIDNMNSTDDVLIGTFMEEHGIKYQPHDRLDILSLKDWKKKKNTIPKNVFHIRVKCGEPPERITKDIYIHKKLIKKYYDVHIKEN